MKDIFKDTVIQRAAVGKEKRGLDGIKEQRHMIR